METFLQLFANGMGKGAAYALLALGFVIIYKSTEVVNFAHGSLALLAGYVAVRTEPDLGFVVSAILGVATAAIAALAVERLLVARVRFGDPNTLALLTIGVDVLMTEELIRRLGSNTPFVNAPWDGASVGIGSVVVSGTALAVFATSAALIIGFLVVFRFSDWGVAMRAQAENREAAVLMGIRSARITAISWLVAGLLAGVAVLFIATQDFSGAGVSRGTHSIALAAFPAAIIGGLDSTTGAILGGLTVGLIEALSSEYISFSFSKSAVFLVMLAVLIVRPNGLLGTKELRRV